MTVVSIIKMSASSLSVAEKKATASLAAIYGLRMLGLFMILPVFAVEGARLEGATPALLGLAIGVYGLSQAFLQIPFGIASDKVGRKPMIIAGLLVFALGSLLAASSEHIYGVIAGRALQGAGAVAAVLMALLADLTRESRRLRAMATVGISIGLSFAAAMVAGPLLSGWFGLSGLFAITGVLALCGVAVVAFITPTPEKLQHHSDAEASPGQLLSMLKHPELVRLDLGVMILHCIVTALFVMLPGQMVKVLDLQVGDHWMVWLPLMVVAFVAMVPFIIIAEKGRKMKQVFCGAIAALVVVELLLATSIESSWALIAVVALFFIAFNLLEASLPSLVSKLAPAASRGSAMGVYASSQFFGAFLGGSLGGWLLGHYGQTTVFLFCAALLVVWLLLAATMAPLTHLTRMLLAVGEANPADLINDLRSRKGIAEAELSETASVVYLKVDKDLLDSDTLALLEGA